MPVRPRGAHAGDRVLQPALADRRPRGRAPGGDRPGAAAGRAPAAGHAAAQRPAGRGGRAARLFRIRPAAGPRRRPLPAVRRSPEQHRGHGPRAAVPGEAPAGGLRGAFRGDAAGAGPALRLRHPAARGRGAVPAHRVRRPGRDRRGRGGGGRGALCRRPGRRAEDRLLSRPARQPRALRSADPGGPGCPRARSLLLFGGLGAAGPAGGCGDRSPSSTRARTRCAWSSAGCS